MSNCVKCSRCGKVVSNIIDDDLIVRAYVVCPECIEKDKDLEERIVDLEKEISVPGTQLTRTLLKSGKIGWTLTIGKMGLVKRFFYGLTIKECLEQAENQIKQKRGN
jgi:hypothetical protein